MKLPFPFGARRLAPLASALALATEAAAGPAATTLHFYSAQACATSGRIAPDICAHAAANAAAEFEEKAPRFPTRAACERTLGGPCAISLRGGVAFTPRQDGFRIVMRGAQDVTTTPLARGLTFSSRTALRRSTSIDPRAVRPAASGGGQTKAAGPTFGVPDPVGEKQPMPPAPPIDPHFDCNAYIEPGAKDGAQPACAPAPRRRRN